MEGCGLRYDRRPAGTAEPAASGAHCCSGSLVLLGTVLGVIASPWFLVLSGGAGLGLLYAGLSGTCGMATLLAQLPYNQRG